MEILFIAFGFVVKAILWFVGILVFIYFVLLIYAATMSLPSFIRDVRWFVKKNK